MIGNINEEVLHKVKDERNIQYTIKQGRLTALVTSCANCLLEHFTEGKDRRNGKKIQKHEEEELSSYWMILGKRDNTRN
jgi:hypothetical protein